MAIEYLEIEDLINRDGLRLVLVKGLPSPWGLAAKAMMELKGLNFVCGPQLAGAENPELFNWAGTNSAPVVAWNDENPINRWDDILFLIERLSPEPQLLPEDPELRTRVLGLAHQLCGELGLGWNIRLTMFSAMVDFWKTTEGIEEQARKYGYREAEVKLAESRVKASLEYFAQIEKSQSDGGSSYLVGNGLTAVDFYWAAFCNLVSIPPDNIAPIAPEARTLLEVVREKFADSLSPGLSSHRDRMVSEYFGVPIQM